MVPNTKFLKESLQSTPWYRRRHVSYKRKCALNSICTLSVSHICAYLYNENHKSNRLHHKAWCVLPLLCFLQTYVRGKSEHIDTRKTISFIIPHTRYYSREHIILTCMRMQVRSIIFKKDFSHRAKRQKRNKMAKGKVI